MCICVIYFKYVCILISYLCLFSVINMEKSWYLNLAATNLGQFSVIIKSSCNCAWSILTIQLHSHNLIFDSQSTLPFSLINTNYSIMFLKWPSTYQFISHRAVHYMDGKKKLSCWFRFLTYLNTLVTQQVNGNNSNYKITKYNIRFVILQPINDLSMCYTCHRNTYVTMCLK